MKLPSAAAEPGMQCERCGREAAGDQNSHFSFCPDCRLFVCDRCWDRRGLACHGCVAKRSAERTAAAFDAANGVALATPAAPIGDAPSPDNARTSNQRAAAGKGRRATKGTSP
jgi:hypothetical protein